MGQQLQPTFCIRGHSAATVSARAAAHTLMQWAASFLMLSTLTLLFTTCPQRRLDAGSEVESKQAPAKTDAPDSVKRIFQGNALTSC